MGNLSTLRLSIDKASGASCLGHQESRVHLGSRAEVLTCFIWVVRILSQVLFPRHFFTPSCSLALAFLLQASFFVVYNMVTTEVIAVFENTSDELLELFENFCDLFRNATLHSEVQFPCSASSNNFARQIQRR